jgi:hypothetical protein
VQRAASLSVPRNRPWWKSDSMTRPVPLDRPAPVLRNPHRRVSVRRARPLNTQVSPQGNDPITIFCATQPLAKKHFTSGTEALFVSFLTAFAERKGLSQENLKFSFDAQSLTGYENASPRFGRLCPYRCPDWTAKKRLS